jgi:hypothetical protein
MSEALIRKAFEAKLKTWADAQVAPVTVAWQNVELTQAPVERYLRSFLLPLPTLSEDLGRVHRRFEGVYQITVVEKFGVGTGPSNTVIAALAALFPTTTDLVEGSLRIHILQPLSAATGIQTRDRYEIPCSLSYRADTY